MKLKDFVLEPESMNCLQEVIKERMININLVQQLKSGKISEAQCLIAELCVVETKLDALMHLIEDGEKDFSKFNEYIKGAAIGIRTQALKTRELMTAGIQKKG